MVDLVCDTLRIGGESGALLSIEDGWLTIEAGNGLAGVRVIGAKIEAISEISVRMESTAVEVHASGYVKVDAGGVGYTYTPSSWEYWYPYSGAAYMPAPPEHPVHGGEPYSRYYDPED